MSLAPTPHPWRVYKGFVHPSFDGPGPGTTNGDHAICELLGPDAAANGRLIVAAHGLADYVRRAAVGGCHEAAALYNGAMGANVKRE